MTACPGDGLPQLCVGIRDAIVVLAAVPSSSPFASGTGIPSTGSVPQQQGSGKAGASSTAPIAAGVPLRDVLVHRGDVSLAAPVPINHSRTVRVEGPSSLGAFAFVIRSGVISPGSTGGVAWGPGGTLWALVACGAPPGVATHLMQVPVGPATNDTLPLTEETTPAAPGTPPPPHPLTLVVLCSPRPCCACRRTPSNVTPGLLFVCHSVAVAQVARLQR